MYLPSTPAADAGRDGDADAAERKAIRAWIGGGAIAYDVRGDFRLDGDVDTTLANTSIIGGWNTAVSHGPISCGFPPSGPLMWCDWVKCDERAGDQGGPRGRRRNMIAMVCCERQDCVRRTLGADEMIPSRKVARWHSSIATAGAKQLRGPSRPRVHANRALQAER